MITVQIFNVLPVYEVMLSIADWNSPEIVGTLKAVVYWRVKNVRRGASNWKLLVAGLFIGKVQA